MLLSEFGVLSQLKDLNYLNCSSTTLNFIDCRTLQNLLDSRILKAKMQENPAKSRMIGQISTSLV